MRQSMQRLQKIEMPISEPAVALHNGHLLNHLWNHYVVHRDDKTRGELLVKYSYLVRHVLGRMKVGLVSHVDQDDLASAGTISLIQSLDRFDPNRGIKFETFAYHRIQGGILDYLRKIDYLSRSSRERIKKVRRAISVLRDKLDRAPTDDELMVEMKVTRDELKQIYFELNCEYPLSLESHVDTINDEESEWVQEGAMDSKEVHVLEQLGKKEIAEHLSNAIQALPEREKMVISLYYYDDLTFKEIGALFNVSESRICQMHTKALLEIEAKLSKRDPA